MSLTLANKITIGRILAVPFFITALLSYSADQDYLRYVALGVFLFAVISDVVDGYIARVHDQKTQIGAILDPLADKILLISAFVCLYAVGHELPGIYFPIWLVVAVISRDVMLVVGSVLVFMFHGKLGISVSVWGKAATFFQAACVIGLLLQWPWTSILWYAAFIFTVVSGLDYFWRGFNLLNSPTVKD